jgi:hypothetical protein
LLTEAFLVLVFIDLGIGGGRLLLGLVAAKDGIPLAFASTAALTAAAVPLLPDLTWQQPA